MSDRTVVLNVRLDEDEAKILDALAAHEERSKSDVVRRAIRAYADTLGVKARKGK